jgi:hypothetical protein
MSAQFYALSVLSSDELLLEVLHVNLSNGFIEAVAVLFLSDLTISIAISAHLGMVELIAKSLQLSLKK